MSDALILQMILAISSYCQDGGHSTKYAGTPCYQRIWKCAHATNDTMVIVTNLHNCISTDLKGELK